jgi:hypothetical protein
MRGRVCCLQFLLVLASAVIYGSESRGTRDHILLYQIGDFPFCRLLPLTGLRWRYSTPPPLLKILGGLHRRHHIEQLIVLCCPVGCPRNHVLRTCYRVATRSLLSVITETIVYLAVAYQRTSGSGSTIPAIRRHVT